MNLSKAQIRTLADVSQAGCAVRVWRTRYMADWRWLVNDKPASAAIDRLIKAGCVAINDNDRNTAFVTPFGRTVLAERKGRV